LDRDSLAVIPDEAAPMDPMVRALVTVRRGIRAALPLAAVALLAAAVLLAAVQPLGNVGFGVTAGLIALLVVTRIWQRTRAVEERARIDVELGLLLLLGAFAAVIHIDGGLGGAYYGLVLLAIAAVSAFASPKVSLLVIAIGLGFEAAIHQLAFGGLTLEAFGPHVGFAVVFGALNMLTLRSEVARLRKASQVELESERERIREQARSYRLLRAPRDAGTDADSTGDRLRAVEAVDREEHLLRSGVEEIRLSVLFALRLLRESLGAHTAILLWLDTAARQLRINELASDDADLSEGPFAAGDGIPGVVLSQRASVCVSDIKPSFVLPYYRGACPVRAVCAAPVFEHGALRGVLVLDRVEDRPFTAAEQALVEQAARLAARTVENERVFVQLERTKVEQGTLYRAADALGSAVTEQEVVEAGVSSAHEIASVDFAAFTAFEESSDTHHIRAVSGDGEERLIGRSFRHNAGLVSMALRNRHPLPYRGEYDESCQTVFEKGLRPPAVPSLIVLPLLSHDRPLGTLVLGSRQPRAFDEAARGLLEVLASHMAVSLSNARMVRTLEEQATTDGLTGLLNKRALLDTADQMMSSARRFGRPLSVLVADIDLFKRVNDTYGHDVGDEVIKELARIHAAAKRTTDAVARFGGEEFVTICEQTDAEGALLLAERIRAEFGETVFHAGGKQLSCTCSVGIATFPDAGSSWVELFKAADEALYHSKRSGRDRATIWSPSGPRSCAAA
jgi:diguanylate cyclase (GGDEF)-like protein